MSDSNLRRRRLGSATRLASFLALLLAAILSITAFETERVFANQSVASATRNLASEVDSFERATAGLSSATLGPTTVAYLQSRVLPQGEEIVVQLPNRSRLGSAGSAPLLRSQAVSAALDHPSDDGRQYRTTIAGIDTLYLVTPIKSGSATLGTVVVASDLSQFHADQNRVSVLVVGEALVALVGAVAGAYLLLRRLLRNVGHITSTAASIESGDLDRRLGDQGTDDEVGKLAATFDSMLDRLQAAITTQRRLLSDVSHQLRTPLTVARGHLEVLTRQQSVGQSELRDTANVVIDELDHMRALVERLLMLGRALEPDFLDVEKLDLRTFLTDLCDSARVLADRRWLRTAVPDLVLDVDVSKLRGALLNLIDNAVRATSEGDTIRIAARRDPRMNTLALSVDDSGPGIPRGQLAAASERFARPGSADRDGSGLGLAIAKAVAEAHGGELELGPSFLGGCRAAIVLPGARVSAGALTESVGV